MDVTRTGPSGETVDTGVHRALGSATRVAILNLVRRAASGLTAREVADTTRLHLTTAREHLDRLTDAALLTRQREPDGTPGRPAWRYRAAATPTPAAGPYKNLAAALVGHVARTSDDPAVAGAQAGEGWGRDLAADAAAGARTPIEGLLTVLDRIGFAPRLVAGATEVHLHACPFLDLATDHPEVVCALHLGVVRGALGEMGASRTEVDLEPFATPAACVLRISPDPDAQPDVGPPEPGASPRQPGVGRRAGGDGPSGPAVPPDAGPEGPERQSDAVPEPAS